MGRSVGSAKDLVRERSEGKCEKCGVVLTGNVNGIPDGDTARSIHHRQPRRCGGKDSVINLVNLCVGCHRGIHEDEETAAKEGWIVIGRFPGNVPFLGWRGWILPRFDGSTVLLDFTVGRAVDLDPALAGSTRRRRVATRSRQGHRKSRKIARGA
jgi:hypothetical protein